MINELIILLTDKQQASLIEKAKANGYDDDLSYLQLHLNEWLSNPTPKQTENFFW